MRMTVSTIEGAFDDPAWFALPVEDREARLREAVLVLLKYSRVAPQVSSTVVQEVSAYCVRPDW